MTETWTILRDVVVTLGVAVLLGAIAQGLRQSPVIGYLIAGLALGGPGSLGLVENVDALEGIAELGVAMLLFSIGLDFSYSKLRRFGRVAIVGGLLQVALTALVTAVILTGFGASMAIAVAVGMMVALSSTAVVVRVLMDNAQIDSVFGLAAVGVLLVQDILLIPFLLLVPDLTGSVPPTEAGLTFLVSLLKIGGLAAAMYVVDYLILTRAFDRVGGVAEREELLVLMTVVIAFGAAWATHAMGLSAALGAFLAGLMIAGAPYADHVRAEIGPLRVVLVTLFFAGIGMLADVTYLFENAAYVAGLVAAVVAGKALIATGALRLAGTRGIMAVLGGVALAQMGEFSFVLAAAARSADIVDAQQFQLIISVSLLSLLLTPIMLDLANRISARGQAPTDLDERRDAAHGHDVVVGYGPAGARVVQRLLEHGRQVTVVELNPRLGDDAGARTIHGDAGKMQILRRADVPTAASVTITIPDPSRAQGLARRIQAVAPDAKVILRGRYFRSLGELHETGAVAVVDEETQTGEHLARATLDAVNADTSGPVERVTDRAAPPS